MEKKKKKIEKKKGREMTNSSIHEYNRAHVRIDG